MSPLADAGLSCSRASVRYASAGLRLREDDQETADAATTSNLGLRTRDLYNQHDSSLEQIDRVKDKITSNRYIGGISSRWARQLSCSSLQPFLSIRFLRGTSSEVVMARVLVMKRRSPCYPLISLCSTRSSAASSALNSTSFWSCRNSIGASIFAVNALVGLRKNQVTRW